MLVLIIIQDKRRDESRRGRPGARATFIVFSSSIKSSQLDESVSSWIHDVLCGIPLIHIALMEYTFPLVQKCLAL